ncbi:MAG: heavy-metal-associated domain-containing protein [Rikenellaceae bacterium]
MKNFKLIITAILIVIATYAAQGAAPKKEIITRTYSAHIHCESCKKKIMNTLPFKKGVKEVEVDMPKQQITVKFDSTKSSDAAIIEALKSIDVPSAVK